MRKFKNLKETEKKKVRERVRNFHLQGMTAPEIAKKVNLMKTSVVTMIGNMTRFC